MHVYSSEGNDAAGKSSQINLICEYLESIGKTYKKIHFPMYGKNEFAETISAFLRGEYGDANEVDPLFVANIYAMDRYKEYNLKHVVNYEPITAIDKIKNWGKV
jgi:dTMP kinase